MSTVKKNSTVSLVYGTFAYASIILFAGVSVPILPTAAKVAVMFCTVVFSIWIAVKIQEHEEQLFFIAI